LDKAQEGSVRPIRNIQGYLVRCNLLLVNVFLQLGHFIDPSSQGP